VFDDLDSPQMGPDPGPYTRFLRPNLKKVQKLNFFIKNYLYTSTKDFYCKLERGLQSTRENFQLFKALIDKKFFFGDCSIPRRNIEKTHRNPHRLATSSGSESLNSQPSPVHFSNVLKSRLCLAVLNS
jgi:hypothetical protein